MEIKNEFNHLKPIYYNYMFKNFLNMELENINKYHNILLCVYSINTTGKYPFIRFLLSNNESNKLRILLLPNFRSLTTIKLMPYSKVFLSGILRVENFEEFNTNCEFNGFYEFNKSLYLFFDITNYNLNIDETYLSTHIRFVLTDEIINHKHVCNIPILPETIDFFIKNESVNYLYNEKNIVYEIPIVGYVGKSTSEKVNFVSVFGETAKNKSAILGPYFYFTDFNHAIRQAAWSHNYKLEWVHDKLITENENGRYIKGGIIRFALFMGKIKYIENMPNDENDESDIKKERLNDKSLNNRYEILTLRISDHDGIWSKTYDSVYLGNIELDDGSFIEETPLLVLKEYNQQIPLSFHFIDKTKLGEKFILNADMYNYSIL